MPFAKVLEGMVRINGELRQKMQKLLPNEMCPAMWWHLCQEESGEVSKEASKMLRICEHEWAEANHEVARLAACGEGKEEVLEKLLQELLDQAACLSYAMDLTFPDLDPMQVELYAQRYTLHKIRKNAGLETKADCPHLFE